MKLEQLPPCAASSRKYLNTPLHGSKAIRLGCVSFLAENDSKLVQLSICSLLLYPSPLPSSADDPRNSPYPQVALCFHFQLISGCVHLSDISIPSHFYIYTIEFVYWCMKTLSFHAMEDSLTLCSLLLCWLSLHPKLDLVVLSQK